MILVIGLMALMTLVVTSALTFGVRTISVTTDDRDYQTSEAGAQAGINDFLAVLKADSNFWQKESQFCDNVAMQGSRQGGVAAGAPGDCSGMEIGWIPVAFTPRLWFHYDLLSKKSDTVGNGQIKLAVTGRVGGPTWQEGDSTRTVLVTLERASFGEFLYYTDYETTDPDRPGAYANPTQARTDCTRYGWAVAPDPVRASYCNIISFGASDVINGPLHTNDTIQMVGAAKFNGTVTTSRPTCVSTTPTTCYSGSGTPQSPFNAAYRARVALPREGSNIRQYADPVPARSDSGCLYSGPTRIRFYMSGATARMKVWSKLTSGSITKCGTDTELRSLAGADRPVPPNNLIYVQAHPTGTRPSTDPSPLAAGWCKPIADVAATRTTPAVVGVGGQIGDLLPLANDATASATCTSGDAYVEGSVGTRASVYAENNVVVTNNVTYANGAAGTDALGLMAQNSVVVYHPTKADGSNIDSTVTTPGTHANIEINAAIQTLQHSFTVQSHDKGAPLTRLTVFGAIAQRFRGPVGTSNSGVITHGYAKNYNYDRRLRFSPPPYLLEPEGSGWTVALFGETTACYRDGRGPCPLP